MKFIPALTYTKPDARISWKLLLYAVLCTLLGTACIYCFIDVLFMNGFGIDGGDGRHPYDQAAMTISFLVASVLWFFSCSLWCATLSGVSRKKLHILLTAAIAIVGFCPAFLLMSVIRNFGEKIGQLILYG